MSERLRALVQGAVNSEERYGVERVALRAGLSPTIVRMVMKSGHVPQPKKVRKLALACGLTDDEAWALTRQSLEEELARETA